MTASPGPTLALMPTLANARLSAAERRMLEIRSFFIQEVDRDKIVLHGSP